LTAQHLGRVILKPPKLNQTSFMIRITRSILSLVSLKIINCAYFHSATTYGLIFGGNSAQSVNIFKLQKIIIRIIMGARPKDFCREFLKTLQILLLASQYILSIALFMIIIKICLK
jgi:hypothetical protein